MIVPPLSAHAHIGGFAHVVHRQISAAAPSSSDAGDGAVISAEDLIHTADEHWNVSGASVIAAWLLTVVVGIVIATVFSTVRGKDRWQLFYFPRVESQKDKAKKWQSKIGLFEPIVPVVDRRYFGWLTPQLRLFWLELFQPFRRKSLTQKDTEMLELIGLDGVTYLHFLRLLRWLFLAITLFAALPLTIANYYLNTSTEYGSRTTTSTSNSTQQAGDSTAQNGQIMGKAVVDDMLVFTAANVVGNGLWVHIGFEWVVTGLVIFFVFAYSSHYDTLVRTWVELNYNDTSFRSLLITDFRIGPKRRAKDEKGAEYQKTNYVSDAKNQVCAMLGIPERPATKGRGGAGREVTVTLTYRNMSKLSKLMEEFKDEHFSDFSRVLTAYLRRNVRQFGDGAVYDSCWDRVMGNARNVIRRTDEKGTALLLKKERIEMEQALARCDPASGDTTVVEGEITSAFVTFATTKRAYAALKNFNRRQKILHKINGPDVQRAPRAYNIIWENLDKVGLSKRGYSWTGVFILLFVFGINLIPLAVITLLANYEALLEYFPTLKHANETSTFWSSVFALLGGIVPPSISALFAYLLPYIVRRLNKWSGALTRGELDKTVVRQLFIWLLAFNFVFFSPMGIIWETYLTIEEEIGNRSSSEIWESLGDIPAKVTKAYISQSSYWLSWYPIRALVTCIQLLQLPRIGLKLVQSFTAKTATDLHELAKPPKFEFAIEYVHALFAMAVALVLTPLAPIVAMCSTIYFWAMTIVHYNTLNYVEDSKETDGKCWRIARNRLLAATVIMQLLMTVTIWLKTRTPTLILLAALPFCLIIFVKYREGEDDLFLKVVDLISERGLVDSGPIPQYEHALLQRNWMPEFHYTADDRAEYLRALDWFGWMRPLFTTVDWDRTTRARKKKGRLKWREGRRKGR